MTTHIHALSAEAARTINLKIEQHVRLFVRPKPRWCPSFLWKWLLRRVLVMQMTLPTFEASR